MEKLLIHYTREDFRTEVSELIATALTKQAEKTDKAPAAPTYETRRQIAQRLNISLQTLHRLINAGKLTRHSIGGRVLFRVDEVTKAVEGINGRAKR